MIFVCVFADAEQMEVKVNCLAGCQLHTPKIAPETRALRTPGAEPEMRLQDGAPLGPQAELSPAQHSSSLGTRLRPPVLGGFDLPCCQPGRGLRGCREGRGPRPQQLSPAPFPAPQIKSDKQQLGSVIYSIQGPGVDEEPRGVFSIDKFTGKVFLNAMLDREKTDRFRVRICAVRPVPVKQAWWESSTPPPHQTSAPARWASGQIQAPLSEGPGTGVWDQGPAA